MDHLPRNVPEGLDQHKSKHSTEAGNEESEAPCRTRRPRPAFKEQEIGLSPQRAVIGYHPARRADQSGPILISGVSRSRRPG